MRRNKGGRGGGREIESVRLGVIYHKKDGLVAVTSPIATDMIILSPADAVLLSGRLLDAALAVDRRLVMGELEKELGGALNDLVNAGDASCPPPAFAPPGLGLPGAGGSPVS